jgi:hypothetical protein
MGSNVVWLMTCWKSNFSLIDLLTNQLRVTCKVASTTLSASSLSPSSSFALRWPPPCLLQAYQGQPARSHLQGGLHQLGSQVPGATFTSVIHELPFACSWITLILDATIWLHGDRPPNTCIPPTFLWIMVPAHHMPYPRSQHHWGGKAPLSGGYAMPYACAIQGKDDGIQVLAGLAPSSQIEGYNIRVIHEQAKNSSWTTEANMALATSEPSWLRWWRPPSRCLLTGDYIRLVWQMTPPLKSIVRLRMIFA